MEQSERYLKRLRRALVCPKEDRERLLRDAGAMLENFTQENPDAFYKDYVASFGQPEDFAAEMLSNLDPEDIADVQRRRKRVFLASAAAMGALLVLLAGFWFGRRSQSLPPESPQPTAATPEPTSEPTPEPSPEESVPPASGEGDAIAYVERSFTDSDRIEYKEAVGYMVRLGVMSGTDDGSFDPTLCLDRAQIARMATLIMMGGTDRDLGVKEEPSFSDIKGHWAEPYIEFCRDLGVLDGQEDGSFGPDEAVTALELIRVALRMLGYDADAYRLRGKDWSVRTDELARTMAPSLYSGLVNVGLSVPVTRDTAAQIFFNALQATPKRIVPSHNTTDGTITWQYVDSTREDGSPSTLLRERFNLELEDISFD